MKRLEPPDSHNLRAAIGWLELGLPEDAKAELKLISREYRQHPDVLEVCWRICAEEREWDAALEVARKILSFSPNRAESWLHHAYSLRRAAEGGLAKALEALEPAAQKFPEEPIIPYNLSCYACQMRQLDEARDWLKMAAKIAGKRTIKRIALADADLEPLWEEIQQL